MDNEELKPCPMCGDNPHVWAEVQGYGPRVSCQNHKCSMDGSYNVDDWNTRAPITREQVNEWAENNGFAMVPLEPTKAMLKASERAYDTDCFGVKSAWPSDIYKTMIKAAQESK